MKLTKLFDTVYWVAWVAAAIGIVYYFEYVHG